MAREIISGRPPLKTYEIDTTKNTADMPGFKIYDNGVGPAELDDSTNSLQVIDYAHHEIHSGSHFVYCEQNTLAQGAARDLLIVTPDTTKWTHLIFQIRSSGEANFLLYEGTTTSNDGTGVTEVNRNRNSATTAATVITHTPTVTGVGTLLCTQHFGAGQTGGGLQRSESEWVLKQNTKYLLRVTSEAASNDISTMVDFYEHTNKN